MSRMGIEIAKLRQEAGMTHKQLAKLVGVSEGFIADVEAGKKVLNGDLNARILKALHREAADIGLFAIEENMHEAGFDTNAVKNANRTDKVDKGEKVVKTEKDEKPGKAEKHVQAIWNDALAGVIMAVPVYNFRMDRTIAIKQLPIIANKVEGIPKDKVFYLEIEDNEMTGFRISKGDRVLAFSMTEIDKDGIFFIEYDGKRSVRHIKKINNDKLLLMNNNGSLKTDTLSKKDMKVLARLVRVEIAL